MLDAGRFVEADDQRFDPYTYTDHKRVQTTIGTRESTNSTDMNISTITKIKKAQPDTYMLTFLCYVLVWTTARPETHDGNAARPETHDGNAWMTYAVKRMDDGPKTNIRSKRMDDAT